MNITDRLLTPGAGHGRSGRMMTPRGIVVHYLGAPGGKAAGAWNWFETGSGGARVSAHYVIDLDGSVLRCLPDNECGAHAGKSYGAAWDAMARTNNSRFIGIECCHPSADGRFNENTYAALTELCADLCVKYGFSPETDIYRHYDVSGKSCPLYYVRNPDAWRQMKDDISAAARAVQRGPANAAAAVSAVSDENDIPVLAAPSVSPEQMQAWARSKNAAAFFVELAPVFYAAASSVGADPAVVYCQSALETGFGHFGGVIDETYCNPCGMKTAKGGENTDPDAHMRFGSWEEGIAAQTDHLALYAGALGYPKSETPDPRHFASIYGRAKTVQGLTGTWATDPGYAGKIIKMIAEVRSVQPPETAPEAAQVRDVSGWAREAWAWATDNGLCDGTRPGENTTREETVMMICRLLAYLKKQR